MRVNDIFAIENGEHIRILLCSEEQCYAVSCHHFRMPFPLSTHELEAMKSVSTEAYDFLENRYGKENVIQAIVHDDEGGQPHLHFCFVPVVEDPKHDEGYKVCANEVLDRRELRNFHPDLQRYLDEHGLEDAHIMTGVTKQQGGNRTVAQLKAEREQEIKRPSLYFGEATNMQHLHF